MNTVKNDENITPSWVDNEFTDLFAKPLNPLEQLFHPPQSIQISGNLIQNEKFFAEKYDTITKKRLSDIISLLPEPTNIVNTVGVCWSNSGENLVTGLKKPDVSVDSHEYPHDIDFVEDIEHFETNNGYEDSYLNNSESKAYNPETNSFPAKENQLNSQQTVTLQKKQQKVIQIRTPTSTRSATYSCNFSHQKLHTLQNCFDDDTLITKLKL
jgi:hypothetical protein